MPPSDATPEGQTRDTGPAGWFVGIGLTTELAAELAGERTIVSLTFTEIATAGLHRLENAEIGCLLLGNSADALDIIAELYEAGYRGLVTVIAPPLPNPHMIERELATAGKPMAVRLLVR